MSVYACMYIIVVYVHGVCINIVRLMNVLLCMYMLLWKGDIAGKACSMLSMLHCVITKTISVALLLYPDLRLALSDCANSSGAHSFIDSLCLLCLHSVAALLCHVTWSFSKAASVFTQELSSLSQHGALLTVYTQNHLSRRPPPRTESTLQQQQLNDYFSGCFFVGC